jgi:putative ABC transport system permease protein
MVYDLRFGLLMIHTHGWFSAAVVATLALGIGLNTMVFVLVNAALFRPVPVPGGERLVALTSRTPGNGDDLLSYSDLLPRFITLD